jgi:hypothetical protein
MSQVAVTRLRDWTTESRSGSMREQIFSLQAPSTGSPMGVRLLKREADHSLHSSAVGEERTDLTSTPQQVFLAWYLFKNGDNLHWYNSW